MTLNRVPCPECGAGLKSPTGFTPGQTVCCPKCETYFTIEDTVDTQQQPGNGKKPVKAAAVTDDDYDAPKKKKKKAGDESERSYKNSPLRYAVLGVLVCVMAGLGVMLYLKKSDEGKQNDTAGNDPDESKPFNPRIVGGNPPIAMQPAMPGGVEPPKITPKPKGTPQPKDKKEPAGGGFSIPFVDGGSSLSPEQTAAKVKDLQQRIVGSWSANLGGGKTAEVVYRADGTFSETHSSGGTPKEITGRWTVDRLTSGNKGVLIVRTVGAEKSSVRAEFDGDELLHDTQERGTVGTFRKK